MNLPFRWRIGLVALFVTLAPQNLPAAEAFPDRPSPLHGATSVPSSLVLSWSTVRDNAVVDGGFEGHLGSAWQLQTLGTAEVRTESQIPPRSGGGAAFVVPTGRSGSAEISQRVHLPVAGGPLRLSWAATVGRSTGIGGPFNRYQVELRDADGAVVAVVFDWRLLTLEQPWDRYAADLSAWRGQDLTLAFVAELEQPAFPTAAWLGLDDVHLGPESSGETFEVFLGRVENLGPSERLGQTTRARWPVRGLPAGRHYWQVIAVSGDQRIPGPVWTFTVLGTGRRPETVDWIVPEPPLDVTTAAPLTLLGTDPYGHPVPLFNTPIRLAAEAPDQVLPSIVLSEVSIGPTNAIELMNVSSRDVTLGGWRLQVVTRQGSRREFVFPEGTVAKPGDVFHVHAQGPAGAYPVFGMPSVANFGSNSAFPEAVALYDAQTNSVDLFVAAERPLDAQTLRPRPSLTDWQWPNVRGYSNTNRTWQRIGFQDRNRALDWRSLPRSIGVPNPGLRIPFAPGPGPIAMAPEQVTLTGRSLATHLQFSVPTPEVTLLAEAPAGNIGVALRSGPLPILSGPPIELSALTSLNEGGGAIEALRLRRKSAGTEPVTVDLSLDPPGGLVFPEGSAVTIPAGATEAQISLQAADNNLLDGTRRVRISGTAPGFAVLPAEITVHDDEQAALTLQILQIPSEIFEGTTTSATVELSRAPDRDIAVELWTENPNRLHAAGPIRIPAGATSAPWTLVAPEDAQRTGDTLLAVELRVAGWQTTGRQILVRDNEPARLSLALPEHVEEGDLTPLRQGMLMLSGVTPADLVVTLASSDDSELRVTPSVTVPAGQSAVRFDLIPVEDTLLDGAQEVVITARAEGYSDGQATLQVLDNEPAGFVWGDIPSPRLAREPFPVTVQAMDVQGRPIRNFSGVVTIAATNAAGILPFTEAPEAMFSGGSWNGFLELAEPGDEVRLTASWLAAVGVSAPFHVLADPVAARIPLSTFDIAWDANRSRLIASVRPEDPNYPGRLVALDPETGAVIATIAEVPLMSVDPFSPLVREGRLLVQGDFVWVAARGATWIHRYEIATGALRDEIEFYTPAAPGFVADLCAFPGRSDTVVAASTLGGSSLGIAWIRPGSIERFPEAGATLLAPDAESQSVFGYLENSPFPAIRIEALGDDGVQIQPLGIGPVVWAGGDLKISAGEVIFGSGRIVSAATYEDRGQFAVEGQVQDPIAPPIPQGRVALSADDLQVLFLTGESTEAFQQLLQIFSRDDPAHRRRLLRIRSDGGPAARLLLLGSAGLAFNTHSTVVLVKSPWLTPSGPEASLLLGHSLPSEIPATGSEFEWTLTLKNDGPAEATDILVEVPLPEGLELRGQTLDAGQAELSDNRWRWHLLKMAPDTTVTAHLRVVAGRAGDLKSRAFVQANQWNPRPGGSSVDLVIPVKAGLGPSEAVRLDWAANDAAWDAVGGVLWISSQNGSLLSLDPETGRPVHVLDPGGIPGRLKLSSDGATLFVAVGDRFLRSLNLATRGWGATHDLARTITDLAPIPGRPGAVLVAGERQGQFPMSVVDASGVVPNQQFEFGVPYLTFGESPEQCFGLLVQPGWPTVWSSYRLTDSGIIETERLMSLGGLDSGANGISWVDGRLLLSSGHWLETASGLELERLPNSGPGTLSAADVSRRRILTVSGSGPTRRADLLDLDSWARLERIPLPGLDGNPVRVVPMLDAAAVVTDQRELALVRFREARVQPPTDLSISMDLETPTVSVGTPARLRIQGINAGDSDAHSVRIATRLPKDASVVSFTSPHGAVEITEGVAICTVPRLEPGASAVATLELRPEVGGALLVGASITSRAVEEHLANNHSEILLPVRLLPAENVPQAFASRVQEFIRNPANDRLIASIAVTDPAWPGAVVELDPATGLSRVIHPGLDRPGHLAISSDGSLLYVVENLRRVVRVETATGRLDPNFAIEDPLPDGGITSLAVPPGNPRRHLLARGGQLAAYDDGRRIEGAFVHATEVGFYSADEFVAVDTSGVPSINIRGRLGSSGIETLGEVAFGAAIAGMTFADGRLYSPLGTVFDTA